MAARSLFFLVKVGATKISASMKELKTYESDNVVIKTSAEMRRLFLCKINLVSDVS